MAREYVFIDEWDVRAPQEEVFVALADARTYPRWWKPTYRAVEADGPPAVGCRSHHRFKAKLPYTLSTTSTIVRLDPPHEVEAEVDGDLRAIKRAMVGLEPYAQARATDRLTTSEG
ncbi:MAG TPA: SRPBCC family protein [Solirubrobacteraceae bacterium]|nr:SRPBCC family protein [Solirubrobacteraceae bacterium]